MTIEQLLDKLRLFNKDSVIDRVNNVSQYDDEVVILNQTNKTKINVRKLVQLLLNYPDNYRVVIKRTMYPESVSGAYFIDNKIFLYSSYFDFLEYYSL